MTRHEYVLKAFKDFKRGGVTMPAMGYDVDDNKKRLDNLRLVADRFRDIAVLQTVLSQGGIKLGIKLFFSQHINEPIIIQCSRKRCEVIISVDEEAFRKSSKHYETSLARLAVDTEPNICAVRSYIEDEIRLCENRIKWLEEEV